MIFQAGIGTVLEQVARSIFFKTSVPTITVIIGLHKSNSNKNNNGQDIISPQLDFERSEPSSSLRLTDSDL